MNAATAQRLANDVNGLGDELESLYRDVRTVAEQGRYELDTTITRVNEPAIESELKSKGYKLVWRDRTRHTVNVVIRWEPSRNGVTYYTVPKGLG